MIRAGLVLCLLVVSACVVQVAVAAQCRALALEGGGARGAYYAGVIRGMVEATDSNSDDLQWNVVSGISAGAIVGFGISLFSVGDEDNMSQALYQVAANLDTADVYKLWPPGGVIGLVEGVLDRSGLFDTDPLRATANNLATKFGGLKDRKLVVGATSLTRGGLHTWNETVGTDGMINAIMASSAIPGVFPTQHIDGETFCDGGVVENLNIFDAVKRCEQMVDNWEDITVDIILSSGRTLPEVNATDFTTLRVLERTVGIGKYDLSMSAVNKAKQAYPDVNWRYLVWPQEKIPNSFNFTSAAMQEFLAAGLKDGKAAVNNQ